MSGALIVPENIPGVEVNPTLISQSASSYRSTASSIGSGADTVLASWSGLGAVYSAPESGQLLASMDPVGVDAHTIEFKLTSMSGLLDTLAEEVAAPVRRLTQLKAEAEEFVASVQGGVTVDYYDPDNTLMQANAMSGAPVHLPEGQGTQVLDWSEHSPSVARNNELLEQVAAEAAKLSAASAECVNGINALRDDMCSAPVDSISAEQFETAQGLPWGEVGQGDRSCSESVGDGMWSFGEGLVGGVVSLAGFDIHDGWSHDWGTAGGAWGGMASTLGALAITGPITTAMYFTPNGVLPDWAESVSDWHTSSMTALVEGIVGSPEQWEEDPVAAGTTALLNVGTFFIPGVGVAAGSTKAASTLARVSVALERGAVRAGDGTLTAGGLTRAGTLASSLSESLNFLTRTTPGGTTLRDLDAAVAGLDDIRPLQADNMIPATVDAPPTERGSTDASASTAPRGDTTITHSESGSTTGGGTTLLERTDLGDNGTPGDRGGSGDVPADHGGSDVAPTDRDSDSDSDTTGGDDPRRPLTSDEIAELPVVRDGSHLNRDGSLQPDTWYRTGEHEYVYHTNESGHIDRAIAEDLRLKEHDGRLKHDPKTLGKLPGDHAGHLLADWFGGSPKLDNVVSQLSEINLSKFKRLENTWANTLMSDPPGTVSIDMRIVTDPTTGRPTRFEIDSIIDGKAKFSDFDQ